jgi:hypothetical protein
MLYSRDGFVGVVRQALDKLGIEWEPTEAERAYNKGRSTQVPVNPVGQYLHQGPLQASPQKLPVQERARS